MRVLVLGSGGREHALAWTLQQSPLAREVICAPGNAGIAADVRTQPLDLGDVAAAVALARSERVDLVVVGPEAPLAAGLADRLNEAGIPVFGPSAAAAQLESSKAFAKAFMQRHGVPTADHRVFEDADAAERYIRECQRPLVVKADGLAAGKGVTVASTPDEALAAVREAMRERRFGSSGARVVIEERLKGEEASFHAICDGERFVCLPAARDWKRALDGDQGENTGGMGTCSPVAGFGPEVERAVVERVVRPVLDGMRAEGHPFRGVLYAGLMLCADGPQVIEFNVRFGDPETQPLLFRLDSDLLPVLLAAAQGRLDGAAALRFREAALCVVLASEGYPRSATSDVPIDGLDAAAQLPDVKVFHAGTRQRDGHVVTAGGRVLGVTARGATLAAARERAYQACERIRFKGMHHRRDIGVGAGA
jgi:phosphoribosylamine---glycine ligase